MITLDQILSFLKDWIKPIVLEAILEAQAKPKPQPQGKLLTLQETMRMYPISHTTIYRLFDTGQLSKHKLNRRTAISETELKALFQKETLTGVTERKTFKNGMA